MIEKDGFWHHKTFKSVIRDLWNMWTEGICKLENASMYCTNNAENNAQMDGVEVIDLCSLSQNKNEAHGKGKKAQNKKAKTK